MINTISAADIAFITSSSKSAWLPSSFKYSPQKQNGWTLRLCFCGRGWQITQWSIVRHFKFSSLSRTTWMAFSVAIGKRIDPMHNDVKQCFCGSNVHCGSLTHTRILLWRLISSKREIEMAVMLTCVLMCLGRPVAAREICLSFQILRTFTISPTTSTTDRHLGFEPDYNYHTVFRACYVIMHKVYCSQRSPQRALTSSEYCLKRYCIQYLWSETEKGNI